MVSAVRSRVSWMRLAGLLLFSVGLLVLAAGSYLAWNNYSADQALEQAERSARAQARELAGHLARIQNLLSDAMVTNRARDVLAGRADPGALEEALRARGITDILNLQVVPEPLEMVELENLPGSRFEAMEMLIAARREDGAPVQAHGPAGDEYLAFAHYIDDGRQPGAVLFLNMPLSVLVDRLKAGDELAGQALYQASGEQSRRLGQSGRIEGVARGRVQLLGTRFELAWYKRTRISLFGDREVVVAAVSGLLALLLGIFLVRRVGKTERLHRMKYARAGAKTPSPERAPKPAPERKAKRKPRRKAPQRQQPEIKQPEINKPARRKPEREQPELSKPELPDFLMLESESESEVDEPRFDEPEFKESAPAESDRMQPAEPEVPDLASWAEPEPPEETAPEETAPEKTAPEKTAPEKTAEEKPREIVEDWAEELAEETPGEPVRGEPQSADSQSAESDEVQEILGNLVAETEKARDQAADDALPGAPARPDDERLPVPAIFRAYDIRGRVGDTLDSDITEQIGRAIGSEARARGLTRIAIARDGRLSGAELLAALGRGLVATGMEVVEVGPVPTPVLYFAARELTGGSGVMVTGSHNPPEYNGFKIVLGGETLSGEAIGALYERLASGELVSGQGHLEEQSVSEQYLERIGSDIQLERPLKVVADCGNGIAGILVPRLLELIGAEVIPLYAEVDGTFPNHHPDPGDPETLEDLKLCVRNFNADLGVAFDGDGDRLGVMTPEGEIIYPDRLMILFARDVLSRNPGAPIIFDVKCSAQLAREIEQAGGRPVMSRTGHSFIKQRLIQEQAPLAGEMSGHFFFGERWYGFDDALYAACRLLEILAADTRAVGQILAGLPKAVSTPEIKVEMREGEPHAFIDTFCDKAVFEGAEINTIDGVRADFPDRWGLVRASNTTPVLVLRFEGDTRSALERVQAEFREQMLEVNPALKLPF